MTDVHETKALAIIPKTVGELMQLAEILAKSELLPKALRGKVADVAMTMMAGAEMGFGPGASLRNMHIIEGKPVLSASGKVALVRASGKCKYFDCVEDTPERVTYETMRIGATKPNRSTWTKQRVKDAGLNTKDNHRLFGQQMLHARAKSELCENTYEDVLAGVATLEEVGDWTPPDRNADAIDADFTETHAVEPPEIAQIDTFEDEASLKAFAATLKDKVPESFKAKANERYKERLATLRKRTPESPAPATEGTAA